MKLLALDIGGANIKAAWGAIGDDGAVRELKARSVPFALWKEPLELMVKLREAASGWGYDAVAVTMTGELCDCFSGRREGVNRILESVEMFAAGKPVRVWLTDGRFASIDEAKEHWLMCASANWHAQATWVARLFPLNTSLLIDTGSTTTDIVLLRDGEVIVDGLSDMSRLGAGLIYTGATRTPVMSLSPITLPSRTRGGEPLHMIAEHFATMADVYLLLLDLPEEPENCDTADGRQRTRDAAAVRVLRMIGADTQTYGAMLADHGEALAMAGISANNVPMQVACEVACACALAQRDRIVEGIHKVRLVGCDADEPLAKVERVIVTGSGDFVAARAAEAAFKSAPVPVVRLAERIGTEASVAACAVALLHLWSDPRTGVRGL